MYPRRQSEMLQASAGLGREGFRPLAPFGSSPDGLGVYQPRAVRGGSLGAFGSPLLSAVKTIANRRRGLRGLGDEEIVSAAPIYEASGVLVAAVALGLVMTGVSGYYVGKAVAPSSSKESKYAWWGVAAALFAGPVGLGIEAGIALNHKGG